MSVAGVASLASLLRQTSLDDDAEVLRAANAALKQSKGDLEAQHVKVVALLKLDRFDEALRALEAGGPKLQERAALEHAYALYKSGNPSGAADIAKKSSERAFQHVEAQASYRVEDFERAAQLYGSLSLQLAGDAKADLRINSGAVDAQLHWAGRAGSLSKSKPEREDLEAFETAYNAACGSIARGELGQAEVLLRRARDLCSTLGDLSEEDKSIELTPIMIQQVYVLQKLGRGQEAKALAEQIQIDRVPDLSTRHVADINRISTSASTLNPFLAQRILQTDLLSSGPDRPFAYQSSIIARNALAANLLCLKFDGTLRSTGAELSQSVKPSADPLTGSMSVANAAALSQGQTGKDALKHILPVLERRPKDVGLTLTAVQLQVANGNIDAAVTVLQTLFTRLEQASSEEELEVRFAPGLVGTAVSLYEKLGRRSHARSELLKATSFWKRASAKRPAGVPHLFKVTGAALLSSQDPQDLQLAESAFADVHQQDGSDRYAAIGVVAASPDREAAVKDIHLTPIDRLVAGIDVDALEGAGIAQPQSVNAAAPKATKRVAEEAPTKKPKKPRPSRLPKDYDSSKMPDPERWLPLRDRSSYRPKGKKGKARQAQLSQGAVANDSDAGAKPSPAAEVLKQKQAAGGGGNKKKKGKGNKW